MEGSGIMKSFREIIQNQLLFEGSGIMKSFGDRNEKWLILNPKSVYICLILPKKSNAETACKLSLTQFFLLEIDSRGPYDFNCAANLVGGARY